ncbi:hypothetical protein CARUB_v10009494mg [Capsella rubella]|uniref:Dof-type domain-containing protein n=1 Tax=Capsella rubella TaxID=81985 RepID=R0ILX5_9BRAS|nr:dof zinc finger protein DOF1.3 [Capsella rubella]EOA38023.1 hypothetical protein CARUB_v10009494mg [Capsella rubella]
MSSTIGMSEVRDTPVKLFGWTITSVSHDPLSSSSPVLPDSSSSSSSSPSLQPHMMNDQSATEDTSLKISSDRNNESKETSENSEDQHSEITTTTSEEKTTDLKKPDKILPCPRCNSANTKFCYFNNYNVNQPRHFCRNCQRYWTAGGSMRTVPVGSGRRKNKGWVSSDHYLHITSEDTDHYNSSSAKILNFESSDSSVTENAKHHQSRDANTNPDFVSQEQNNFQGFLPPQETSPVSHPWPYQYPPNSSFYHMPVYWGCAVPVWSTVEASTCLGKRKRDEASHETATESKDAFVRARLVSESQSINNEATTENNMWYPVSMKHEKTKQFNFFSDGSERKSNNNRFVPQTYLNLQANPAAMARSMNFRESM